MLNESFHMSLILTSPFLDFRKMEKERNEDIDRASTGDEVEEIVADRVSDPDDWTSSGVLHPQSSDGKYFCLGFHLTSNP